MNYFDNKAVELAIAKIGMGEDIQESKAIFATEIAKLVSAVINANKLERDYIPREDMIQGALTECVAAIQTFNSSVRTAFTYFSLVAKYSIWNQITKANRCRNEDSLDRATSIDQQNRERTLLDSLACEDPIAKQDESDLMKASIAQWVNESRAAVNHPEIAKEFLACVERQHLHDKRGFYEYCNERGLFCVKSLRKFFRSLKTQQDGFYLRRSVLAQ